MRPAHLAHAFALVVALLLLSTAGVTKTLHAQTAAPTKVAAPIAQLPPPGNRTCCAFGFAIGCDPAGLFHVSGPPVHQYGNHGVITLTDGIPSFACTAGERVGYVYTAAGGLVDIGHVRDNADWFLWIYEQLVNKQHSFDAGGNTAGVVNIPTAKEDILTLAGSIAYVSSWAHELQTWGDTNLLGDVTPWVEAEDYSAFSPEDLSSNIVGIEVATRAIRNGGDASVAEFNHQIDVALAEVLGQLKAQPINITTALLVQVKFIPGGKSLLGKWWMDDLISPGNYAVRLLRRNFDGSAWKIAGAPDDTTPTWLATKRFSDVYPQFLYLINTNYELPFVHVKTGIKETVDATQVPRTSEYALEPTNSRILRWTPVPPGKIPTAGIYTEGLGGSFSINAKGKSLANGQFADTQVNVYTGTPLYVIANMQDATKAISDTFVLANPGMAAP